MIQHIVRYSKIKYIIIHYIVRYSKVLFTINYNTSVLLSRAEYMLYTLLHYNVQCTVWQYSIKYSTVLYVTIQYIWLLYCTEKKYATIHYNTFNSTQYNKYITGITRKYNTVKFSVLQPSRIQLYKFNI